ncbi:MAG: M12 family metallo-peptidase [Bacteroidota bacterium]
MKKLFTLLFLTMSISIAAVASGYSTLWHSVDADHVPSKGRPRIHTTHMLVYAMNTKALLEQMRDLSFDPLNGTVLELPLPDGSFRDFHVWQSSMMEQPLAEHFPNIKTYTAYAIGNQTITAKIDFTEYGFSAMIYDGDNTSFIDPYSNENDDIYMVTYKNDQFRNANERMRCDVVTDNKNPINGDLHLGESTLPKNEAFHNTNDNGNPIGAKVQYGHNLHRYRLAISADHFYCQAATGTTSANPPTMAQCMSKIVTSINRVNGVYERDFSGMMIIVAKDTAIVWPAATGNTSGADPYTAAIDANSGQCLTTNQTQCDSKIGTANYDYGHIFTTGGGGLSGLGIVCSGNQKAQTVTGSPTPTGDGFDIDYVAHEMGHAWGCNHAFNDGTNGSCGGGNRNAGTAYEPASGTSIMNYAGICSPDDMQQHSDAYFHAISLKEENAYIELGAGHSCANDSNLNHLYATLPAFAATYAIPDSTPFELISPAITDSSADTANRFCWDQYDLGAAFSFNTGIPTVGPCFRSFNPSLSRTRVFPTMSNVLVGTVSYFGERLANTARTQHFCLTTRSFFHGYGTVLTPTDQITLNIQATGRFKVTSPAAGANWNGGTSQTVTWDVVNTTAAPISCDSVDIYISNSVANVLNDVWAYYIGKFPNTGTATFTSPNPAATLTQARVKVKGHNNVFFNVNAGYFTLTYNSGSAVTPNSVSNTVNTIGEVKVYPVPTNDVLHISTLNNNALSVSAVNTVGQLIWNGEMTHQLDIPVSSWAKGIYYIQILDKSSGDRVIRSVVVE